MIVKNGYIWSDKKGRWIKLPRHVWHKMQCDRLRQIADRQKQSVKNAPELGVDLILD